MRNIAYLTDADRQRCLGNYRDNERAQAAFRFGVDWFRVHPPRESDDKFSINARCCRAVEYRGRNEQVCGEAWHAWDVIVHEVIASLTDWLFERVG